MEESQLENAMSEQIGLRGKAWFQALTGQDEASKEDPASVLTAEVMIGDERALFLCVIPNPGSRFPCVRDGQVGLEEGYTLAHRVREALNADKDKPKSQKRPIIAIIDVKSQAYGHRERDRWIVPGGSSHRMHMPPHEWQAIGDFVCRWTRAVRRF